MTVTFEPLVPLGLVALAAFVLAFAELAPVLAARAVVGARARLAIAALYLVGVALALLPLLGPRLEREHARPRKAVVLVDSSRSMATEDALGGASRYDAARRIARSLTKEAGARWETRAPSPGERSVTRELPASATGASTALGDAIAAARALPDPPDALVLVSDGAQTRGADAVLAAREARASGIAVSTVLVGDPARTPPPAIDSVELAAPRRVATGARTVVHVSAELEGLEGVPVEASLALDGVEVGRVPFDAAGPRARREASFEVALDEAGEHSLEATVRSGPRTARATRRIRAIAAPLRVALIDCPARWEHRFLRRALEDAPRLELHRVDLWNSEPDPRAAAATIAAVASADVIILGDVPRRLLPPELGPAILAAVEREGAGLLLLGGHNAFGAALDLGLGVAFPVEVGDDVTPVARSFRPEETDEGRALLANALAVRADEVRSTLEKLPPLATFEPLGTPRRGARVVLEAPGRRPLLVTGRWGLGRTAVLATDETWRWAFTPAGERARGGTKPTSFGPTEDESPGPREAHAAILRELLTALAPPGAGLEAPVALALDRERFAPGTAIEARVSVAPASSASACVAFRATLEDGSGKELARATFPRAREGETRLTLEATPAGATPAGIPGPSGGELLLGCAALDAAGKELAHDTAVVRVLPAERPERVGEPADATLLVRIADAGGGAAFAESDVTRGDARRVLAAVLGPDRPAVRENRPLAQGAGYVLVLALVLSASWGLRRAVGLR
jgi:hypothetical protein